MVEGDQAPNLKTRSPRDSFEDHRAGFERWKFLGGRRDEVKSR
jgi:hypothetical protein